ncbi:MAG: hypothetical protein LBR38_00545 [Synergistaceae bacterium]|jgi:hypothetical protein|nr:hypothetical protein [Synergistaceae bacterium]
MKDIARASSIGLRYWNSDIDLEIASWFPFGVDYKPVSINELHSLKLERIAARCLDAGSEFFFLSSMFSGCVGSLMRDNFFREGAAGGVNLGFMMLLGYSPKMEELLGRSLAGRRDVRAGVAFCSLRNKTLALENMKVIVLVSDSIIFGEEEFLTDFEAMFDGMAPSCTSYFAEKFGYRRFHMAYETDDMTQLRIGRLLYEMEFPETRRMVGPSPEMPLPPFLRVSIGFLA